MRDYSHQVEEKLIYIFFLLLQIKRLLLAVSVNPQGISNETFWEVPLFYVP